MDASTPTPRSDQSERRWTQHPTVRFLAAAALLFGLYYGYGYATAPSRLTPALKAHLATNTGKLALLVTAKFPPEEFQYPHLPEPGQHARGEGLHGRTRLRHALGPEDALAVLLDREDRFEEVTGE